MVYVLVVRLLKSVKMILGEVDDDVVFRLKIGSVEHC